MKVRKFGVGLIIFGTFGIALSALSDLLPGGKAGMQSAQILGIEISTVIILIGVWLLTLDGTSENYTGKQVYDLVNQTLNLPVIVWLLIGFLVIYILFFISPLFLNTTLKLNYLDKYLPERFPIGNDLVALTDLIRAWFLDHRSPYPAQFYPPLTYLLFSPLLLVGDYATLYKVFTVSSLASYILLTLLLPAKIVETKKFSIVLLFFITGLFSYGFQFELERGQYNIFTFLLCVLSIYIFHYHRKQRLFAYLLFSLSIQLKLYPAIFIVMFVDDWRNWKDNIARFAAIGVFNFLLLFSMGPRIFSEFIQSVFVQVATPSWNSGLNHSIQSFVEVLTINGLGTIDPDILAMLKPNLVLLKLMLFAIYIAFLVFSILLYQWRGKTGLDANLLLVCTIGALIIPVSYDYTLSILAMPMSLFLSSILEPKESSHRKITIILLMGMSLVYSSMLIPPLYKPPYLGNNFPALFLILILAGALAFMNFKNSKLPTKNIHPSN